MTAQPAGTSSRWNLNLALLIVSASLFAASIFIVAIPHLMSYNAARNSAPASFAKHAKNKTAIKDVYEESASFQEILNKFEPADYAVCELQPDQRNELGRSTWALLHIMASSYPANPPPNVIFEHLLFFQLLPKVYPCPECRVHMAKMFAEFPPQLETQQQFTRWLCEAHNRVNARIGKPIVNCDEMDSRWDCGCNIVPGEGENVDNAPQVPNADWNSRPSRSSKSKRKHRS